MTLPSILRRRLQWLRATVGRCQSCKVKSQQSHHEAGFTLLELLLVMGIMSMLAAVSYPIITGRMQAARIANAKIQISSISTALEMYAMDTGTFPPQQVGLAALLQQPANTPTWRGPYLKSGLTDPWGTPYNYKFSGGRTAPEVYVAGTDKNPAISSEQPQ